MKKIIILLLLVALAASYWFFFKEKQIIETDEGHLVLYGNVDIRDVTLGFRVAGRLAQLHFEEGDKVVQGDVMAVLDTVPFQQELTLREAEHAEIQVQLSNAEKQYSRRVALVKTGAVSQTSIDDLRTARDETKARLQSANARTAQALTGLEDTQIIAPNNGVIMTRVLEPGAIVQPGSGVYNMALLDPVWIRCYVDEPNLGMVYSGQQAVVTTDSGGSYTGQVGFISPQAEFTPKTVEMSQLRTDLVYRLRVIVSNANKGLRQGMPVTIRLIKRR